MVYFKKNRRLCMFKYSFLLLVLVVGVLFWNCEKPLTAPEIANNPSENSIETRSSSSYVLSVSSKSSIKSISSTGSSISVLNSSISSSSSVAVSSVPAKGSRLNPAKLNESITFEVNSIAYGHCNVEMKVTSVIKGATAWAMVQNANMFNSAPDAGKEYILVKFYVKNLQDLSGKDEPFEINSVLFDYADSVDKILDDYISAVAGLSPDIDCTLYQGASHEGWAYFQGIIGEAKPKAVYRQYAENKWFDISGN